MAKHTGTVLAAALAAIACQGAVAQGVADSYPSKPVTFIVSVAPGASVDFEARLYTTKLSEITGKTFVTDYKPGAGTTIGNAYVAKAAPDGHTVLIISPSFTVAPLVYPNLPYDNDRDFAPVSMMTKRGSMFVVHPSLPVKNAAEYFSYARANPGKVNVGTSGNGSVGHMSLELLHMLTKSKVTFVHYKGGAPSYAAVLKGEVDLVYGGPTAMLQHVKSGKLRILAFTTMERSRIMPDVPALSETVPGFEYALWLGVIAPAATPVPIVNKLSADLARVAKAPDVVQRLEADSVTMVGSTPAEFRKVIAAETARWKKVVQDTGIKPGA
jgi:tripartite-type tricarboxylate transporter receptor subunit TctC